MPLIGPGSTHGARGRSGGEGVGRQDGPADQSRFVGRGVRRARRAGGDEAADQGGDREKKGGAGDERPASGRSQSGTHDYSCWAAERVQNTDWRALRGRDELPVPGHRAATGTWSRSRGRRTETPVTTTESSLSQTCGVQRCCQPAPARRSWHPPRRPPVSSGRPQEWPSRGRRRRAKQHPHEPAGVARPSRDRAVRRDGAHRHCGRAGTGTAGDGGFACAAGCRNTPAPAPVWNRVPPMLFDRSSRTEVNTPGGQAASPDSSENSGVNGDHPSAYAEMSRCVDTYMPKDRRSVVVDFGSYTSAQRQQMTHRHLLADYDCEIIGVDIRPGLNVDRVMEKPYRLPMRANSVDFVMSGQVFEHIPFFWASMLEIARVLKTGGHFFMTAPSRGHQHTPVDCWRYYPDGVRAMAAFSGLEVVEVRSGLSAQGGRREPGLGSRGPPTRPPQLRGHRHGEPLLGRHGGRASEARGATCLAAPGSRSTAPPLVGEPGGRCGAPAPGAQALKPARL